jgi:hypothetical protein
MIEIVDHEVRVKRFCYWIIPCDLLFCFVFRLGARTFDTRCS